jgi:hypothetical protein
MTSEFGNGNDNVENIDVLVTSEVPEDSDPDNIAEVELLPQDDDGDFDDADLLDDEGSDEDVDEEDSDESDEDSEDDFDDDAAEDAENTDYDAQPAVAAEVTAPVKQTVVIETLPITGEPRVDDALSRLSDLEGLPVHEHGDVFEDVRRRLHGTLSDLSGQ